MGRRVLVTGLSTFWGARVAQALEADPDVEAIIGLDTEEPSIELERTEFVRADHSWSIINRLVRATQVDTVLHTFLVVDSTRSSAKELHETNVIGTMNLLAAAGAPGSSVRQMVVKSSGLIYGAGSRDPAWWTEEAARTEPATTRVERSLLEVEGYLSDFADDNPHVSVTLLRFANVLGQEIRTPLSKLLELPLTPAMLGFDPMLQFVEETDVLRSLLFVMRNRLPGIFNVGGDGKLPWSECASIAGKRLAPIIPPVGAEFLASLVNRLYDLPPEVLQLLTYGRALDNRRLKQHGFEYAFTSAGAVESFAQASRLRATIRRGTDETYHYERDVESFFRHSPAVVRD